MVPDQSEGLKTETVQAIPLEQLRESAWNPRRRYTPEGMAELTQSIRKNGIRVPLLVRPHAAEGNAYEIGAGHRRYRAAREAGLALVPCLVRPLADTEFLELLALENLSHEDLTELEEAQGYRDLIERAGLDVKAITAKTGKNQAHIYARLKLLDAVDEVKQALTDGKITAGHAILIARLPAAKDQREALEETVDQPPWRGPLVVRELETWIKREMYIDLAKAPFAIAETGLVPAAGACTTCGKRTSAQPETYPETEQDKCLDRACYRAKIEALRKRALAEHPEAVKITTAYSTKAKGIYPQGEYELVTAAAPKDAAGLKEAVFLDGARAGQVVKVRLKPENSPAPGQKPPGTAKEREAELKRKSERLAAKTAARREILKAIEPKITGSLLRQDLLLIATAYCAQSGENGTEFGRLPEKKLARELLLLVLRDYEFINSYDPEDLPSELVQVASRYGVDAVAIEKKTLAALESPAAAKPVANAKPFAGFFPIGAGKKPAKKKPAAKAAAKKGKK